MPRVVDRMTLLALLLGTATPFVVTGAIQVLPSQVALGLAAWILASVPLGISIGHCVLNDE
ncbi:MAG: hypothetical protein P4L71_13375 [Acetobacteraceae bacterium]|nr:hypothetical protein [Acetobacteraceae bacterium]